MPSLVDTETWDCPNHAHCGAWAYIKTYDCGCVRVEWQDRGSYDPDRCAHKSGGALRAELSELR